MSGLDDKYNELIGQEDGKLIHYIALKDLDPFLKNSILSTLSLTKTITLYEHNKYRMSDAEKYEDIVGYLKNDDVFINIAGEFIKNDNFYIRIDFEHMFKEHVDWSTE